MKSRYCGASANASSNRALVAASAAVGFGNRQLAIRLFAQLLRSASTDVAITPVDLPVASTVNDICSVPLSVGFRFNAVA